MQVDMDHRYSNRITTKSNWESRFTLGVIELELLPRAYYYAT